MREPGENEVEDAEVEDELRIDKRSLDSARLLVRAFMRTEFERASASLPIEFVEVAYYRADKAFYVVAVPAENSKEWTDEWTENPPWEVVADRLVAAAAEDIIDAREDDARFTVRLRHHNAQKTFTLHLAPEEDEGSERDRGGQSQAMAVVPSRTMATRPGWSEGGQPRDKDIAESLMDHVDAIMHRQQEMVGTVTEGTRDIIESLRTDNRELREENRRLRGIHHEVIEQRENLLDRSAERAAAARRGKWVEEIEEQTAGMLLNFGLPTIGSLVFSYLQQKMPQGPPGQPGSGGVIVPAFASFVKSLDQAQWEIIQRTLRPDQMSALQMLIGAIQNDMAARGGVVPGAGAGTNGAPQAS